MIILKRVIHLFLFLFFFVKAYGQKDSIISKINVPRGYFRAYYADSIPKLVNGKPYTGLDSFYFINVSSSNIDIKEQLKAVETFVDGYKIQVETFYDNGVRECLYQFKKGKRHGLSQAWYKSGKQMFDNIMENGKNIGVSVLYYENGDILSVEDTRSGTYIRFHENGKPEYRSKEIIDSVKCPNGGGLEVTYWDKRGQLQEKSVMNCGKQRFLVYANDSIVIRDATIVGMSAYYVGPIKTYYNDGKIQMEGSFEEGPKVNVKTGEWKYWDEKGKLVKIEYYEKNKLIKAKEDSKGIKEKSGDK